MNSETDTGFIPGTSAGVSISIVAGTILILLVIIFVIVLIIRNKRNRFINPKTDIETNLEKIKKQGELLANQN